MNDKRFIDWFFVTFVMAALLFRLGLMHFRYAIGWDEPHYLNLAAGFISGNFRDWLHPFWSPLFPAVAGLVSVVVSNLELAGRLTNAVCGTLILVPIFYMAKKVFDRQTALLAVGVGAFFPPFAFASTTTLAEPLYTLLAYLGMWVGWRALERSSLWRAALAGALFGLAYLARPEGTGWLVVYCAFVGVLAAHDLLHHRGLRRFGLALAAAAMWLLVASPYLSYLRFETGRWTLSAKAEANQQLEAQYFSSGKLGTFDSLSPDNHSYPVDRIYHDGTFVQSAQKDGSFPIQNTVAVLFRKYATHFYRLSRSEIAATFSLGLIIPFALGLFGSPWLREQPQLSFYLLSFVGFFWLVLVPLFHINERYIMPLLPIAMIWIGQGIVVLRNWFAQSLAQRMKTGFWANVGQDRAGWICALGLIALFAFVPQLGSIIQRTRWDTDFWYDAVELKLAGQWLRQHSDGTPVLLSHNKAVNFYAGNHNIRSGGSFSQNEWSRIVQYARFRGVTHVVWDERYAKSFPRLAALGDPSTAPPELTAIYDETPFPGLRTIIYRLDAPAHVSGNGYRSLW